MASAIQATKAPARKGSLACYRWYPKVSRIQAKAAQDVGRGSETLMTFARGDLFKAARRFVSGESRKALVVTGFYIPRPSIPPPNPTVRLARPRYARRSATSAATHGWSATHGASR